MIPVPRVDIPSPVPSLITGTTANINARSSAAELAATLFDLRRDMMECLLRLPAPLGENPADFAPASEPRHDIPLTSAQEDILRDTLPPLHVPAGPYTPVFSAWRGAITAVIGLIFGSALAQGLQIGGALAIVSSMVGVGLALWLAESLAHARAAGTLNFAGRSLRWKHVRRWGPIIWGAALVLTLLRDFLQQNSLLDGVLGALSAFLMQGAALPLLQNMYWFLGFTLLFVISSRRPVRLDMAEYRARLHMLAEAWWGNALLLRSSVLSQYAASQKANSAQRQKAAQELYSFAGELPSAQSFWLRERLEALGFSTPMVAGEVCWEPALATTYDMVGHVIEGDLCFVDTAPLMNGEQVLRKGTVRKIRKLT